MLDDAVCSSHGRRRPRSTSQTTRKKPPSSPRTMRAANVRTDMNRTRSRVTAYACFPKMNRRGEKRWDRWQIQNQPASQRQQLDFGAYVPSEKNHTDARSARCGLSYPCAVFADLFADVRDDGRTGTGDVRSRSAYSLRSQCARLR